MESENEKNLHSPQNRQAEVGEVVQIRPTDDAGPFGGCFLIVEKVKKWGVQGAIFVPTPEGPTVAYYRCTHDQYLVIGDAVFTPQFGEYGIKII